MDRNAALRFPDVGGNTSRTHLAPARWGEVGLTGLPFGFGDSIERKQSGGSRPPLARTAPAAHEVGSFANDITGCGGSARSAQRPAGGSVRSSKSSERHR